MGANYTRIFTLCESAWSLFSSNNSKYVFQKVKMIPEWLGWMWATFQLSQEVQHKVFFVFFCLFDCQQYVTCQTQSLGRDPACRIIFLWHTKATKVCLLHVAKLISSFQRRRKPAPKIIFGGFTRAPYHKPRPRTVCAFTLLAVSPSPLLRLILHAFLMSLWCFTVLFFLVIEREDLACSRDYFFLLRARRNKSRSSVSESL